jgi:hypothetical protein
MTSLTRVGQPVRAIGREAHHLHDVERAGESESTPWIALLGLILFFAPVAALMTVVTFAAYYLTD